MSQTLRRDLRQKFITILKSWNVHDEESLASELADAALESLDKKRKPAFDLSQSDPAWAILKGEPVRDDAMKNALLKQDALNSFEFYLQLPESWQWYGGNSSDEKALEDLRNFVIETYEKDNKAFEKYQTWRTQPFARGAMSNLAIKKNPENFRLSWSDFLASQPVVKAAGSVQTDKNGNIISY